jgi:SAM-dependent methyltransferase
LQTNRYASAMTDPRTDAELDLARRADAANLSLHNLIETTRPAIAYARWMRVNCEIDPRDEIYRFFATHPSSLNPPRDYLSDGWRSLVELEDVLDCLGLRLRKLDSMLEFASGYGRLTRHLAPRLRDRLWVSDVMPGAVDFARSRFDVSGFDAHTDPALIEWPRQFELVFVLSLLTHVPPARWRDWLPVLMRAVAPGGWLVFSVHSEGCAKPVPFDASGEAFMPASESSHLNPADYGTTYMTRAAIARRVEEALGRAPERHTDTVFWVGQDAVCVRRPR